MADLHPRIRRVRRIGVVVFLTLAVASVPIALHIKENRATPELWLTLLGAVLLMVLISLFALETAAAPIPEPTYALEADAAGDDEDNVEEDEAEDEAEDEEGQADAPPQVEMPAPGIQINPSVSDLSDQETELDPARHEGSSANPDGPVLVVPNPALIHTGSSEDNE